MYKKCPQHKQVGGYWKAYRDGLICRGDLNIIYKLIRNIYFKPGPPAFEKQ